MNSALATLNLFLCRRYVDDAFVSFELVDHLLINVIVMSFRFEEKDGKLSFQDVEVSHQLEKFVTVVYRKPIFGGVYFW